MSRNSYSIGKLISKLQRHGYEINISTLKRLEEKGIVNQPSRLPRGERRTDRQYTDEDLSAIIRDLEWYYGLRGSVEDTLKLKKAWRLHETLIKKLNSDRFEDVRDAEISIMEDREDLIKFVLGDLQNWDVAKRGDRQHLETRKKALKDMNDLIRSLRDKRNGFGLLKQKLWESIRYEVEIRILERIENNPGIRQSDLYEGYKEFAGWISTMLAEWEDKNLIQRLRKGRTYEVFPADADEKRASA